MQLEEHPFVVGLNEEKKSQLLNRITLHEYSPNTVIFEKDEVSDSVYLVLEGEVVFASQWSPESTERHIISTLSAGGFFGEIGVITGHPRSLAAIAHTKMKVGRISKDLFLSLVQVSSRSTPLEQLLNSVINHLHHTTDKYVQDMIEKEKMGLVGTMMNGIMHDFRNPLNTISMSAQVVASEHSDDLTQELCGNIDGQIKYMTDMARDIEEFSRGDHHLRLEELHMASLFEEFKAMNSALFDIKGINVNLNISEAVFCGDKTKIHRMIQNLMKNAVEALQDKRVLERSNRTIDIKTEDLGGNIAITIKDNGLGIPQELHSNIYKPFVTKGKKQGTGLGMAVVKSNIDAHKGRINFETSDQGTTFTIVLPKEQEKQPEILE